MKNNGKPKLKVQIRGGFSDRNNINPVNKTIQYKEFDERTRTAIANTINALYHAVFRENFYGQQKKNAFWKDTLSDVYSQQVDFSDSVSYREDGMFEVINDTINNDTYDAVLSLIEYIARKLKNMEEYEKGWNIYDVLNSTLEKEFVGYRFVNGYIVEITDEIEIAAIEEASSFKNNKVNEHIDKALVLLADRNTPDYENSIKESISAVEAMCNEITGKTATLGDALKQLKMKGVNIHPALEVAFEKLYGYTSDAAGVRHAGQIGGANSTFDEAKFMLVACSGFVNYLKGEESKLGC